MNPENGERSEYSSAARGLGPLFSGLVAAILIALTLLVAVTLGMGEQEMLAQVEPTATETEAVPTATSPVDAPPLPASPSPTLTDLPPALAASSTPSSTSSPVASPSATWTPRPTRTPRPTIVYPTATRCTVNPWGWDYKWIVRTGDTLYSIARVTGTNVTDLKKANCLVSSLIYNGQSLWVPSLPPTPKPTIPPPVIKTFTLDPDDQIILGECVEIDWVVEGTVESISLLARIGSAASVTLVSNAPKTGSYSDCPSEAGVWTYILKAAGPDAIDYETRSITVIDDSVPPVADFSASPTSGTAPLTVSFTDQSTGGSVTTWSWDFGDGGSSSAENPSHQYTTVGSYTVILTVTGPGGSDTETKAGYITVTEPAPEAPVADFSASTTSGEAPLTVNFSNASTGDITSWSWDFGDGGSSSAENPSHQYTTVGSYTVMLTVTGPGGSDTETKSGYITVTEPAPEAPVANFSASPTSGNAPLTVNFSDTSTGDVTSWSWSFGDGGSSSAENPSHQYTVAGSYTVVLTVSGPGGSDTETKAGYISVTAPPPPEPPDADFSANPTSGAAPLTVNFTDLSTGGSITIWSWDFGDGGSSSAQNPSHKYTHAGDYTVVLTVTGPGGSDATTTSINVDPASTEEESSGPVSPGISVTPRVIALMRLRDQPLPT